MVLPLLRLLDRPRCQLFSFFSFSAELLQDFGYCFSPIRFLLSALGSFSHLSTLFSQLSSLSAQLSLLSCQQKFYQRHINLPKPVAGFSQAWIRPLLLQLGFGPHELVSTSQLGFSPLKLLSTPQLAVSLLHSPPIPPTCLLSSSNRPDFRGFLQRIIRSNSSPTAPTSLPTAPVYFDSSLRPPAINIYQIPLVYRLVEKYVQPLALKSTAQSWM